MRTLGQITITLFIATFMVGCQTDPSTSSASARANQAADRAMYQPISYSNASTSGPTLVVLPGAIKSNNATFTQKFSPNNIADYAEIELGKANFRVLERSDLGPLLNEIRLAVNMGDRSAMRKFKRGKFKSTKWFVRFDVLKAEPVAKARSSFDGRALGAIIGQATGHYDVGTAVGSLHSGESAGVWIVGMRYKVIDANTTEQVTSNYFEQKMEMGSKSGGALGFSQGQSGGVTLDTLVQRLVQQAVSDLDAKKGPPARSSRPNRSMVTEMQTILNSLGYYHGVQDGLAGRQTRTAVSNFQTDNGLPATGRLNSETVRLLREMSGR